MLPAPVAISAWIGSPKAEPRQSNLHRAARHRHQPVSLASGCRLIEKDFVLLGHVASVPNLLCARKDLPVNKVAELIAHAKTNPGKLNYARSGIGTTVHLSAELFKRMAAVDMVHVDTAVVRRHSTIWWGKTSI